MCVCVCVCLSVWRVFKLEDKFWKVIWEVGQIWPWGYFLSFVFCGRKLNLSHAIVEKKNVRYRCADTYFYKIDATPTNLIRLDPT